MASFTITAAGTDMLEIRVKSGELITLRLGGNSPEHSAREQVYALSMLAGESETFRENRMDQAERLVSLARKAKDKKGGSNQ